MMGDRPHAKPFSVRFEMVIYGQPVFTTKSGATGASREVPEAAVDELSGACCA